MADTLQAKIDQCNREGRTVVQYSKVKGTFNLTDGEKVACMISLGYPDDPE